MALSWNEIKDRAQKFSKEWENESSEDAEAKSFWDGFFNVFGISRRRVASFEYHVDKLGNKKGFVDLYWPGTLIVEHKSRGKSLEKAFGQAIDYFPGIGEKELPKYIVVTDFERIKLYDLEAGTDHEFQLSEFTKNVQYFGFIAGYQKRVYKEHDPVNIHAAELMGRLHDKLREIGYEGHHLEVYLVRLLFCLFADDTTIFDRDIFSDFLERNTRVDGSDLAGQLSQLFNVLNTPKEKRFKNIDETLNAFPYVNGKLFEENLQPASFDSGMRTILLDSCKLDWGTISPAIFGSLFQSVMNPDERRNLGAHYTSEKNIMKLIKPLFLDALWKEFEAVKDNTNKLHQFHNKISNLRFLDPACGCGNFLVITYRELRLLEIEIIKIIIFKQLRIQEDTEGYAKVNVATIINCEVDRFYGIEYEEFPAQIAQVAMWLMDHQMNMKVSEIFGNYYIRLPLTKSATIVHGNALQTDWQSLLINTDKKGGEHFDYILGNPPFVGKQLQNAEQKADMDLVFSGVHGAGVLDYVTAWYVKAAKYIQNIKTEVAFVSTNSISQGEQVGVLWNELYNKYHLKIHFAHRTFKWGNEAKGNAAVHVVIIGFGAFDINEKYIFEYDTIKSEPHEVKVVNINPYLIEGHDNVILKRRNPISKVPEISFGSMPNDGGNLILDDYEKIELINSEPLSKKYIRPLLSAKEYIRGEDRWCLWLKDINPAELKKMPLTLYRVALVKAHRKESKRVTSVKLAQYPTLFGEDRQPNSDYILIPRHSSESRHYVPMGFFDKDSIASDSCLFIANATYYHFGILESQMHSAWLKHICGRIKSDYRYSNELVYNNFPWPKEPSEKQVKTIEKASQKVLDTRALFPDSSLADLYDPNTMPPALTKAHQELDKAVDLCYRPQPFLNETKRMEFLFELYDSYTAGLFPKEKKKRRK